MTKDLQQIKDEVAQEWGHTDWDDFGESFKHRLGSAHAERDEVITEIAIRYAQDQKQELVSMLVRCEKVISDLGIATDDIIELIKQATEG